MNPIVALWNRYELPVLPRKREWPGMSIFTRCFWSYVFECGKGSHRLTVQRAICRFFGHDSVVWFNVGGYEPDMHCETCGEDLG